MYKQCEKPWLIKPKGNKSAKAVRRWKRRKFRARTPLGWVMLLLLCRCQFLPPVVRSAPGLPCVSTSPGLNFLLLLVSEGCWWWIAFHGDLLDCCGFVTTLALCFTLAHSLFSSFICSFSKKYLHTHYVPRAVQSTARVVVHLATQSCPTLCDPMDWGLPGFFVHGDSSGKNTGVGCHALLQGIFLTQESNQDLLHCRQILYQLSYQGSPCKAWANIMLAKPQTCLQRAFSNEGWDSLKVWGSRLFLNGPCKKLIQTTGQHKSSSKSGSGLDWTRKKSLSHGLRGKKVWWKLELFFSLSSCMSDKISTWILRLKPEPTYVSLCFLSWSNLSITYPQPLCYTHTQSFSVPYWQFCQNWMLAPP